MLGDGEQNNGGRRRPSILADALEAIFAAISIDSSPLKAIEVIYNLFTNKVKHAKKLLHVDGKSNLQEYLQSIGAHTPVYNVINTKGPDHDTTFNIECVIRELNIRLTATGKTKKEASQNAAQLILKKLEQQTKNQKGSK